jgi:signal transduction histidine kinase
LVIRDRAAILDPALAADPANCLAIAAAGLALSVQLVGLVQVLLGHGARAGLFDHTAFSVVALLWLFLGATVFLQRRASRAARYFLLASAAGSAYLGVGTLSGASLPDALLYCTGLLLFPPLVLGFVRALDTARPWRRWELGLLLPSLLLVWPMAQDFIHGHKGIGYRLGVASVGIFVLAATAQAAIDLWRARNPETAAQMRAMLFGLLSGSLPGIALFVIPLVFFGQLLIVTTWQPLLVLLFLVGMSYAALLFELSEADLIVRRGIVYSAMTVPILLAYGVLGAFLAANRLTVTNPAGGFGFAVVTVMIGAAFGPINRAAHRFVDWLLYGGSTDRWQILEALSSRLETVMQPADLARILVRELRDAFHLRGAFLLLREPDGEFRVQDSTGRPDGGETDITAHLLALSAEQVARIFGSDPTPLLLVHARPLSAPRRSSTPDVYRPLDDLGVALAAPLATRTGLQGILCLQPKATHDDFEARDLEVLGPVLRQAGTALDNALLFARLEDALGELKGAYVRLAREQEAERSRLAKELHDGTAQELAGMITLATVLDRQIQGENAPARQTIGRIRRQAEESYEGVRRASHALRPVILDGLGLVPALNRYLREFESRTQITVETDWDDLGPLGDEVELALFRVTQECMENIRKHSGSHTAHLTLRSTRGWVSLAVSDTGRGIQAQGDGGIGLVGMRERVAAVGGTLRVDSEPGAGSRIEAVVPVDGNR